MSEIARRGSGLTVTSCGGDCARLISGSPVSTTLPFLLPAAEFGLLRTNMSLQSGLFEKGASSGVGSLVTEKALLKLAQEGCQRVNLQAGEFSIKMLCNLDFSVHYVSQNLGFPCMVYPPPSPLVSNCHHLPDRPPSALDWHFVSICRYIIEVDLSPFHTFITV